MKATFLAVNLLVATHATAADDWVENLPPLPTARQEVGVAVLDESIYVIGGILANRTATGIVDRYDVVAGAWESVPPLPGDARLHHVGAASAGGKVFVVGGLNSSFRGVRTLYAFDPVIEAWQRMADLPTARGAMGVAAIGDRIYAVGGQNGGTSFDDFAVYLVEENRWETLPDMPTARNHLAAASVGDIFYAVGGRAGTLFDRFEAYDPLDNQWTTLTPMPTARGGIAAAVVDESIFVFGGEGNTTDPNGIFPQVESYDPATDRWMSRIDMANPRHGIGAAAVDDRVFIPGGSPVQGFGVTNILDAFVPDRSLPSDLTNNGFVDFEDLTILLANWNKDVGPELGNLVDPTNSLVSFADLTVLLSEWTGPGPAGSPDAALGTEGVPEPSSLLLAVIATLVLSVCWRRRAF